MLDEELRSLCTKLFEVREDGLYNKVRRGNRAMAGTRLGGTAKARYPQVKLKGKPYYVHRIVFLLVHGYLPEFIDHIDRDKSNHAPDNLREVTHEENMHNMPVYSTNTTGMTGVHLDKRNGRYTASITVKDKKVHIGCYATKEEAHKARTEYAASLGR